MSYGPSATVASFFFARVSSDSVSWAGTHLVGVRYRDRELFSAPGNTFTLEPDDWNTGLGAGKWRFWEGSTHLGR